MEDAMSIKNMMPLWKTWWTDWAGLIQRRNFPKVTDPLSLLLLWCLLLLPIFVIVRNSVAIAMAPLVIKSIYYEWLILNSTPLGSNKHLRLSRSWHWLKECNSEWTNIHLYICADCSLDGQRPWRNLGLPGRTTVPYPVRWHCERGYLLEV